MEMKRWPSFLALTFALSCRAFAFAQELNDKPDVPQLDTPSSSGSIVEDEARDENDKSTSDGSLPSINLNDLLNANRQFIGSGLSGMQSPAELPKYMIGVSLAEVPPSLRAHVTLQDDQGIMVGKVVKDSPAEKAGLQQYDIILRSGEHNLKHPKELQTLVDAAQEKPISVTVQRRGVEKTLEITPVKREDLKAQISSTNGSMPGGLSLTDPTNSAQFLTLPGGQTLMLANPGGDFSAQNPQANTAQIDALTKSIQDLTQQMERLQQAVDRLEKKPASPETQPSGDKSESTPQ